MKIAKKLYILKYRCKRNSGIRENLKYKDVDDKFKMIDDATYRLCEVQGLNNEKRGG